MKWIQSKYHKENNVEHWFLRPEDWEETWTDPETGKVFDLTYDEEWSASVEFVTPASNWVGVIEPTFEDDEGVPDYLFCETFSTREEAQRWAELEIQPERLKLRLVEWKLDGGAA
jgi:hypothetical protein